MTKFKENLLNQCFDWTWNIEDKRFLCQPFLNIILEKPSDDGIKFKQLVNLLDGNQTEYLKVNIEKSIFKKQKVECHLVFTIANVKFLTEVIIEHGDYKKVTGTMLFKRTLPYEQEEISIIKEMFFKSQRLLIVCGAHNRILMINQLIKAYLGFEEYEVLGQSLTSFITLDHSSVQEHLFESENTG